MNPTAKQYRQNQEHDETSQATWSEDALQPADPGVDQGDLHGVVEEISIFG